MNAHRSRSQHVAHRRVRQKRQFRCAPRATTQATVCDDGKLAAQDSAARREGEENSGRHKSIMSHRASCSKANDARPRQVTTHYLRTDVVDSYDDLHGRTGDGRHVRGPWWTTPQREERPRVSWMGDGPRCLKRRPPGQRSCTRHTATS
jgi:hypothetical protein